MSAADMQQQQPLSEPLGGAPPRAALRRSRADRVVFGVAGGLGRHLGVDPVLVRIAFVMLAVFGGSGVLLYLIGLVVIPEETEGEAAGPPAHAGAASQNVVLIGGAALVLVGSLSLLGQLLPGLDRLIGPALLIAAGVLVILLGGRR